ncbi:MAG: hypothetical protein ABI612_16110, partial [Betaproteobacteria bacterium]
MSVKARLEKLERENHVNNFLFVVLTRIGDPENCSYAGIAVNGELHEKKPDETVDDLEDRVREEITAFGRGGLFVSQLVPVFESSPFDVKSYPATNNLASVSVSSTSVEVPRKLGVPETWLVLLHEVVPRLTRIAVLSNPRSPEWRPVENAIEMAATRRGMTMASVTIRWPG